LKPCCVVSSLSCGVFLNLSMISNKESDLTTLRKVYRRSWVTYFRLFACISTFCPMRFCLIIGSQETRSFLC
jgi:hypothetical protein